MNHCHDHHHHPHKEHVEEEEVKGDLKLSENLFPDEADDASLEEETHDRIRYRANVLKMNAQLLEMFD